MCTYVRTASASPYRYTVLNASLTSCSRPTDADENSDAESGTDEEEGEEEDAE